VSGFIKYIKEAVMLLGRNGGQTVNGGTSDSENLTLTSTTSATKGKIQLGLSGNSFFDETTEDMDIQGTYNINGFPIDKNTVGLGNIDNTSDANKPVSIATQLILNGKKYFHGIEARPVGATNPIPIKITTSTFTLATGTYSLAYWYQGTRVVVSADKTTTLGTAGLYYIYFNGATGNLLNSTTFPGVDITSNVLLASVMWNGSDYGLVNEERHGYSRDPRWHTWAHTTVGVRYRSGITLTHNSGTGASATFATTSGEILDEDIQFVVNAQTTCRLFYQTSATTYAFLNTLSTVPFKIGGANRPQIVNSTGYALTEATSANNRYYNFFVYATTDLECPIYIFAETASNTVVSNNGYTSLVNARAVPFPNLSGLNVTAEIKPIYRIIVRADGLLQAIDTAQDDYRTVSSLPQGAGVSSTTAGAVSFNPAGNISSTTVQTAIEELDAEKEPTISAGTTAQYWRGDKTWQTLPSGVSYNYSEKTTTYTLTNSDDVVSCTSGTFTVTTHASATATKKPYYICNQGTGIITIDGNSSETIDGQATITLYQYESITIFPNGTNWIIL